MVATAPGSSRRHGIRPASSSLGSHQNSSTPPSTVAVIRSAGWAVLRGARQRRSRRPPRRS
ncbi:hypothetical protein [Kitasatospora sp. NPDC098663]|uniref:hypothetical protein n=1 Tax=Kitasatospora sp. NPDC098663 TaxID=3364096 RepID=UPI003808E5FB